MIQTKSDGRELAIVFTCTRCKAQKVVPYEECMKGENYGYLHNAELPEGWFDHSSFGPLLCYKCNLDYEEFMKNGEPAEHEGGAAND